MFFGPFFGPSILCSTASISGQEYCSSVLGKNEKEKRTIIKTIGPVWNGNEVWLITAGGATFAAFPTTYALMFSYLYTALLLLLFSLILRGVSMEFRGLGSTDNWKNNWDKTIMISSFLPALLLGVAFGNIFEGLPMDANGYHGSLFTLLNPYGLLTGVFFVLLFLVHGALWISIKTEGDLSSRASALAGKIWFRIAGSCSLVSRIYCLCHKAVCQLCQYAGMVPVPCACSTFAARHQDFGFKGEKPRSFLFLMPHYFNGDLHGGHRTVPESHSLQSRSHLQSDNI